MSIGAILLIILMVACTAGGNLFLKLGASGSSDGSLLGTLFAWKTIGGLSLIAVAMLAYMWLLRTMPLHVAQSFATAQFIAVVLASALVLREPVPLLRWVGIALIVAGIVVVGLTMKNNE